MDNYFEINALFPSQTSPSQLSMCYSIITMKLPRAVNTFLDGFAELGIDKGLIKNKLLSDFIEKEKGYRNLERVNRILKIRRRRRRRRKWLLRMTLKLKAPKRATTTLKTTVRKQKVVALKRPPPFTLKVPVNIAKTLMCTRHLS